MQYGGRSSVGRARDCDSRCRGFDPLRPPHILKKRQINDLALFLHLEKARSCFCGRLRSSSATRLEIMVVKKASILNALALESLPVLNV